MTAFEGMDRLGDGLVFCAVMLTCFGLAVAFAPTAPVRRLPALAKPALAKPALAKRNRAGARY